MTGRLDFASSTDNDAKGMAQTAKVVQLNPGTLQAFDAYVRSAEAQSEKMLRDERPFLWCDTPERMRALRQGGIAVELLSGQSAVKVPGGLIHDWVGAVLIPAVSMEQTLTLVQDYDHHKIIYQPEVIESALRSRQGNEFQIYLRLLKKKVITVVLDTDHQVHYLPLEATRWLCRSCTTRIAEVENAGTRNEEVLPPDTGHGFLWRLNSYWRFQQKEEGVYVECRAISLTRDIPLGLGWLIEPIIRKLPGESLAHTLEATREALQRSSGRDPGNRSNRKRPAR